MAKVVLGVGCSHSPMVSTTAEQYFIHGNKDRMRKMLASDGNTYTFDELVAKAPSTVGTALEPATIRKRCDTIQAAIARQRQALAQARPDLVVVIGDDQMELFLDNNMPCFSVYWGSEYTNKMPDADKLPPGIREAAWGQWDETPTNYPAHREFGKALIDQLIEDRFDITQFSEHGMSPRNGGMSHAHTFVHKRLLDRSVPIVPVFLNTYYPPNQPRMDRCLEFGRSLRRAIDRWDPAATVALVASGGLSHFIVDEPLDRGFLQALQTGDEGAIVAIPEQHLQSGNSELKLWATLWAALDGLKMQTLDYLPLYRSEAATGCGIAFAEWHQDAPNVTAN